jgi:lipopolysaccharide/colanic/teichoic acid biosynthesis glycosyltransferase
MKLTRWINRLCISINGSRANTVSIIQSQESFRASIIRERKRVDRNQHILSLLLFTVGKQNVNGVMIQQLAHLLAERIRSTDEAGWFDSKRIGVLLPYTYTKGAYKLADEICKSFNPETSILEYTVHTYPSNWLSDGDGPPAHFEIVDLLRKRKGITSQGSYLPVKHSQKRSDTSVNLSFSSDLINCRRSFPEDIGPFFLQPLPMWKRFVDVLCSSFGLVVLSPILLLIALIIKLCYGSPVIFRQQRVGYSGKIFTMWKFRTMKPGAESSLHQQYMSGLIHDANDESSAKARAKLDDDLPVTGFGKILRAMSLDELPQLINVLFGDMTLIGPRPPTVYEVEDYLPWYYERFGIVPGMTGLWQVSGKNKLTFLEMMRLDIRYVKRLSLRTDIVILLKTPLVIASDIMDFINSQRTKFKLKGF